MSVHEWVSFFKRRRINMSDEEKSGRPPVVRDELVDKTNETVRED